MSSVLDAAAAALRAAAQVGPRWQSEAHSGCLGGSEIPATRMRWVRGGKPALDGGHQRLQIVGGRRDLRCSSAQEDSSWSQPFVGLVRRGADLLRHFAAAGAPRVPKAQVARPTCSAHEP